MICTPTYGMYKVSATINEVDIVDVPLQEKSWQMDLDKVPFPSDITNADCLDLKG